MENVEQTTLSQYANSPTITQLIRNMNQYIDQSANFKAFYNMVWNVDTAVGFGLDIWGRIVDVDRYLKIPQKLTYFGFDDGANDFAPFGQAPFSSGTPATDNYRLSDDAYRVLILAKALSNIISTASPALNQLLQNLFPNRGRCYVNDLGGMRMRYTFEFYLEPYEVAIVTSSGVLPHSAGVQVGVLQIKLSSTFGFSEMGGGVAPFGSGSFYL